jgi:UDP-N-acetylglucosamine 4-epimerase
MNPNGKKTLVTGAAGFIGSSLVNHLLSTHHTVVALDNLSTGFETNLSFLKQHPNAKNLQIITGDIQNLDTCQTACHNISYVLHQAALGSVPRSIEDPGLYNDNNITGTHNMLIAARDNGVKRFIYASSSSVYGDTPTLPKVETMAPHPKSPYAVSKLTNEYHAKLFWDLYQLPTIGLRYFNVFGPRQNPNSQYAAAVPKFITAYLENTAPTIYGNGEQTRDFTYIDNVIHANLTACETTTENAYGQAYNIGCGNRISINDLIKAIKTNVNSTIDPIYDSPRAGDVKDSLADITKSQSLLNYTPKIDLDNGLNRTIQWYQTQRVTAP